MRPAKEFPAAREHFGRTSTLKLFSPSNLCDTISKAQPPIEPCAYHAGIIQCKPFICFRVQQFIHCYVIIIT